MLFTPFMARLVKYNHAMRLEYIHEQADWPSFRWDSDAFSENLSVVNFRRGALVLAMSTLGFEVRQQTVLSVLVQDVQKSSEIEGERLDEEQVRSSISLRLGIDAAGLPKADRDVDGVVEMMLDATQDFDARLDSERIFRWHTSLFPGVHKITVGAWRTGPMSVVSGPFGKEKTHFEAPPSDRVASEMGKFFEWFEAARIDPVLKAAIAHLWFVTIHPLDDGNGRIARAITDMALARGDKTSQRFYSMSAQILKERQSYYDTLEMTQRGNMDITPWIQWFLARLDAALDSAEGVLEIVKARQAFWDNHRDTAFNERQTRIINMLLEGFTGKLRTDKYAKIMRVANRTALRDLEELVAQGILRIEGAGRSTSYELIR